MNFVPGVQTVSMEMRSRAKIETLDRDCDYRRCLRAVALVLSLLFSLGAHVFGQSQVFLPDKNIEAIGVPLVPASLAKEVEPYKSVYGLPLADWNPAKREIWLKGLSSVTWITRVTSPGVTPEVTSIYIPAAGVYDLYIQPQGKYLAYTRDTNGNESFNHYAVIERIAKEISQDNNLVPPLKVERVDWFINGTSYVIQDKIIDMISDCGLLIGNLTHCNPNVYHEIGFLMGKAKAEGKDIANILLVLDESVPKDEQFVGFNLRGYKQLRFTKLEQGFAPDLRDYLERFFELKG